MESQDMFERPQRKMTRLPNMNGKRQTNKNESAKVEEEKPNPHTIKRISKGTEISEVEEVTSGHK